MKVMTSKIATLAISIACALLISLPAVSQNSDMVGKTAPMLEGKTPDGRVVALKDLRGKVVLVDFWASWCGPCRAENPTLVKAYKTFRNKKSPKGEGFEIYSVSLDVNSERWKKAIATDKLEWNSHVCDFNGWRSGLASSYGVRQIPSNFIIDKDGRIIAANLKGEELIALLKALFE